VQRQVQVQPLKLPETNRTAARKSRAAHCRLLWLNGIAVSHAGTATVSTTFARRQRDLSMPDVVSSTVYCSISAFSAAASSTIVVEIQIQVMNPITASSEPRSRRRMRSICWKSPWRSLPWLRKRSSRVHVSLHNPPLCEWLRWAGRRPLRSAFDPKQAGDEQSAGDGRLLSVAGPRKPTWYGSIRASRYYNRKHPVAGLRYFLVIATRMMPASGSLMRSR
jgi:hypothetical protein